jgi:5-methylcytosine-specific restriction endonuclease McrA
MKWHFRCPLCRKRLITDWENHGEENECIKCNKMRIVPAPNDQPFAFVDERQWPDEMGDFVYSSKGDTCIIKGCEDDDMTLDHILAWENEGKTSVQNLQPMCRSHNSSKGVKDFAVWLKENNLKIREI